MKSQVVSFMIDPNERQIEIFEKNLRERLSLENRKNELLRAVERIDSLVDRLQGKADGLVSALIEAEGYNSDEVQQYTYDDEKKHFIVVMKAMEVEAGLDTAAKDW